MRHEWDDDDFGVGASPQWEEWGDGESRQGSSSFPRWRVLLIAFLLLVMIGAAVRYFRQGGGEPPDAPLLATEPASPVAAATMTATTTPIAPAPTVVTIMPSPTPIPPSATPSSSIATSPSPPAPTHDAQALAQQMLSLINEDRLEAGLEPVAWDPLAAEVGRLHAEDMAVHNYFSHWNRQGLGPDHRYAQAGGSHAVMENLHAFSYTFDTGQGAPIRDWPAVITSAQTGLMNSPGHRANILAPAHTHVGIGMAYDAASGQFRLAQEFTNHYVQLEAPLPRTAVLGDRLLLQGQIAGEDVDGRVIDNVLVNLAYERFPTPLSLEELTTTSTYHSATESVETRSGGTTLRETFVLDVGGQPGLYHIRVFADVDGEQALLMDHIIEVE